MINNVIPKELMNDSYWKSLIHLFKNHSRLRSIFSKKYFDLNEHYIDILKLKRASQHWATSEKIILKLALHLFNDVNKFTLSDLDYLDSNDKKLAFEAMKIRFKN